MKTKTGFSFKGKYRFIKHDAITGEVISISPWIKNLIMKADTLGVNLFIRRLGNNTTYDCIITSSEIGTGTATPSSSDANLQTPVLTGIIIVDRTIAIDNVTFSFFIPSANLPNGTYNEFGLRCGTQMFARSIITPAYVKGTNENTTIEYVITGNNS